MWVSVSVRGLAFSMPGPSALPTAMLAILFGPASFRLCATSPNMVVASQWLSSLKAWPVYPCPGRSFGRSFSPAAHRRRRRTDSQSPLSSSLLSERTRCRAFSMRSTAVPGYTASTLMLMLFASTFIASRVKDVVAERQMRGAARSAGMRPMRIHTDRARVRAFVSLPFTCTCPSISLKFPPVILNVCVNLNPFTRSGHTVAAMGTTRVRHFGLNKDTRPGRIDPTPDRF